MEEEGTEGCAGLDKERAERKEQSWVLARCYSLCKITKAPTTGAGGRKAARHRSEGKREWQSGSSGWVTRGIVSTSFSRSRVPPPP